MTALSVPLAIIEYFLVESGMAHLWGSMTANEEYVEPLRRSGGVYLTIGLCLLLAHVAAILIVFFRRQMR